MTGIPIKIGDRIIFGKIRLFDKAKDEYTALGNDSNVIHCNADGSIECFDYWIDQWDFEPLNGDNLEIHIEPIE